MKIKFYLKSFVAPLSMLMVFACSPDQYHQKGEYDDIYFTRNDRKQQPEVVPSVTEDPAVVTQNRSQASIPVELQERYTNQASVVYYEEQGPRVKAANELNYDDFVYDYENEQLAYYELPLDWDTDWTRTSFNELMANDYQFKLAWYDQYYQGNSYRMDDYLGQQNNVSRARNSFYGNNVGGGTALPVYGNLMAGNIMYGAMMPMTPMNMAFYDPFWNNRFSVNIGLGWSNFGWGGGWMNPWYDPFFIGFNRWNRPWGPGWGGAWGGNFGGGNTIIVNNNGDGNNRPGITRAGRLQSTAVSTVARDSQNGARIRTRSQRATLGDAGTRSAVVSRSGRADLSGQTVTSSRSMSRTNQTRSDLTAGRINRVSTDQSRVRSSASGSRITRSRVNASRISSGRSSAGITQASGRSSSITRADVSRISSGRSSSRSSALTFDRTSSSSISRAVQSRNSNSGYSRSSNSRSVSGYPSRSYNSNSSRSSSSRSSGVSRSSGSSSRSSGVSRSSGSSGRSSSGSSSSSSRSGGSSRSGRN